MRKFTKEIAALLAAVSVSTSANMATANTENSNASAAQDETSYTTTAGVMVTTQNSEDSELIFPPEDGVAMPPDEYTTTTAIGTQISKTTTTTTSTTTAIGTQISKTTATTTVPPLMGDMQIRIDGDANNDSTVSIADAAAILQYIANPDKYELSEMGKMAADVVGNSDGITVDDAIAIQKLDAKIIDDFSEL